MDIYKNFRRLFRIYGKKSIYVYSLILGVLSGYGAVLFYKALEYSEILTYHYIIGFKHGHMGNVSHLSWSHQALLFFMPIVGGLLVGIILHYFSPDAGGTGTDSMIYAYHNKEGVINLKTPPFKLAATLFTLSSGGSAGKEGPTALIGAGLGSIFANFLNAGARARRTLLLAGTAGGLGAIFCAPLGGALAACEVIYKEDIESDSLIPSIISSVAAYLVFTSITGKSSVFKIPPLAFTHYFQLVIYFLLGLLCFAAGIVFVNLFQFLYEYFLKIRIHTILKPALGGVVVGAVALFFPEAAGTGFAFLQDIISGHNPLGHNALPLYTAGFFLLIAFLRIVTTSFTVATGGSGGVFGPSLFIGGMLGGFVGTLAKYFFPGLDISVAAFILVGMGSFFAGIARAPIAGMIMVCDMIGSYKLLPPLMIVSILSFILSHKLSIYRGQVETRFQSPAHYWDMNLDILQKMTIEEEFPLYRDEAIVNKNILLSKLEDKALELQATDFIVTDNHQAYQGMVSLKKVRLTKDFDLIRNLITVEDAMNSSIPYIRPTTSLGDALRVILEHEIDKIAIVDNDRVEGYIRYTDILKIYHMKVKRS